MLVYGDRERVEDPRERLRAIERRLADAARAPAGLARHAQLVALLIDAGELAQGILDEEMAARGEDDWDSPAARALAALLISFGRAVCASYASRFRGAPLPPPRALERVARLRLPTAIRVRAPEGFVHYAVYPEAYAEAARDLPPPAIVIGVRSIGTSLGAIVAARACARLATVRPIGPPFARRPSLPPHARARIAARHAALVDEGPGLSGSSLCGLAEWIADAGALAPPRIFPSHAGPLGPHASASHRELWRRVDRRVAAFESLRFGDGAPAAALARAARPLIGALDGEPRDLGAGAWRSVRYAREADWPPAHVRAERRKYLVRAGGARWLLRFAGLGRHGEERLARARVLERGGFIPPTVGLLHGFLVQRWLDGAVSLDVARGCERARLLARLAEYFVFLAREFPAPPDAGATPAELLAMARHNTSLALGADAAAVIDRWRARLPRIGRRVHGDAKLHACEWLLTRGGALVKTDALDHHAGHDLVGSQDPAWDLAAAAVEFDLSPDEEHALARALAAASAPPAEPRAFFTECYLAFELGRHTLAADSLTGGESARAEVERLRRAAESYARRLALRLRAA
ncbi:MAG TPA: hypothetical protein VFF06_09010 [Polyangia bacterium]|nr:hypothetical protein [Polyangia bacterium]